MSTASFARPAQPEVEYPDSDGLPLADNTLQFDWIMKIAGGLRAIYADAPDVFIGGDLLWYPVEGDPKTRAAPDAMVVFGRPKKDYRGSYKQWLEGGIAPQVVFEVLSPGNTPAEMARKRGFYDRFGVDEYYLYDPDNVVLSGWQRGARGLEPIARPDGWVSPRLGIRFVRGEVEYAIFGPDGRPFLIFEEMAQAAEVERQRAEAERQRAEAERQRAEAERQRAERLAAKLRELGIDPEA
jgi:Uma2 family endonuclease